MMSVYFSHPLCQLHDNGDEHPESAQRVSRIEDALIANRLLDFVLMREPRKALDEDVLRVHKASYWQRIKDYLPVTEPVYLDGETVLSKHTVDAALFASGAVLEAVDMVINGEAATAFCNVRPPGHHAEIDRAMGFCVINHVAIGAAYALEKYELARVAILDFDVHHGNGTETYAEIEPRVLFASSYEQDIYPFASSASPYENIIKMPLNPGAHDEVFLGVWRDKVWPELEAWQPELIIVSAGFDAHRWDPLANLDVSEAAFATWMSECLAIAKRTCDGRVISVLEGGYELNSLCSSVIAHFKALAEM